jgi:hypothetical protein
MPFQHSWFIKRFATLWTRIGLFSCVSPFMNLEFSWLLECFWTYFADMKFTRFSCAARVLASTTAFYIPKIIINKRAVSLDLSIFSPSKESDCPTHTLKPFRITISTDRYRIQILLISSFLRILWPGLVLGTLFWMSCPGYPLLTVLFCQSFLPILSVSLSVLSCLVLSSPVSSILCCLSCPGYPVL